MLFQFLKYLQPTNYFLLKRNNNAFIFPDSTQLPKDVLDNLVPDNNYKTEQATAYDLSWQAIQKGYSGDTQTISETNINLVYDEYVFSRKYFNSAWVLYVLVIRLLTLKNPVKEISAYLKTRHVKRSHYLNSPIIYDSWNTFNSELVKKQPKVSVIIPTLNRYQYLKDVLLDLEKQDYKNFEVIVIDQSEPFKENFYKSFKLDIKVEFQKEKALWLARNKAIKKSEGNYLLLFDDDSRVDVDWITNHIKCLDFFNADISSGVSISLVGAEIPKHYSFFKISDQLDTGNVLIKKDVFKTIGLFDRQFEKQRMGDGEFGLRAYLNSFKNISNPHAKRLHLKVNSGGLREMGSWDAFRTKKWLSPRPIPSVLYLFRKYFGNKLSKLALIRTVPLSIMPYKLKKNKAMLLVGVLLSILILPLIVFQIFKSWRLSSIKLKQGALIETF